MNHSIQIQNLKCGGCAKTITTKLSKIDSITDVNVDVEKSTVSFHLDNDERLSVVQQELKVLGYPQEGEVNSLGAKAKSFVSCAVGRMNKD